MERDPRETDPQAGLASIMSPLRAREVAWLSGIILAVDVILSLPDLTKLDPVLTPVSIVGFVAAYALRKHEQRQISS